MRQTNTHIFFYSNKDYLSNFYPAQFIINGYTYSCSEQYIMAQKALLFNDFDSFEKIMNTSVPFLMKRYGRQVKNFTQNIWLQHRNQIVYDALLAKFTQNKDLQLKLVKTCYKTLVEASPKDRIYGVGLGEKDDRILNPLNWKGQNLLGKILMIVRDFIINGLP